MMLVRRRARYSNRLLIDSDLEALELVDHYEFLNTLSNKTGTAPADAATQTDRRATASAAGCLLGTSNGWSDKYFNPDNLHFADRELFET
jgi:hypothetical protein